MHIPVFLQEVVTALDPKPGQFFVDGTLGNGGHAAELIKRITPGGIFLGVDRDSRAVNALKRSLERAGLKKFEVMNANFAKLPELVSAMGVGKADGLVLDLGFSSEQLSGSFAGRGFSYTADEPLHMTYEEDAVPVKEIIKARDASELAAIIREYGDERYANRIAAAIKDVEPTTSRALADAVMSAVPKNYERGRIHPATRTFMALRIYANQELESVAELLGTLGRVLKPGGRIAVITFHSGEDRIVKQAFTKVGIRRLNKKPIVPTASEISQNPRARSAKLRVATIE